MREELQKKLKDFKEFMKEIEYISYASGLLYWDMATGAPKKGIPYRGEVLGYLAGEGHRLSTSDTMKNFIDEFSKEEDLDKTTKAMVQRLKKDYEKAIKIPKDRYREYTILTSQAESAWEEAYEKSDFTVFQPYLEKIIEFNKEFIGYLGFTDNKYNTLLEDFEPGITVDILDRVFSELRDGIVELLNKIKESGVSISVDMFKKNFPKKGQESFGKYVLEKMGYDFAAGKLDESVHPFTIGLSRKDVRITTNYDENDFRPSLFSCIHEGGHAIYEQNIPEKLSGTGLQDAASMGIHESQSRFYENIIGRSKEFWEYFYPEAQKRFEQFKGVELEEFHKAMNLVEPSFIRVDADELTYSLHVIIRYEIEKALINEEIEVKDLPKVWNEKYKEYLGIEPKNDSEGVLQDNHWAGGAIGYFPSYALGNLYGAQFFNKMKMDIPDILEKVKIGDLESVYSWLKENIHKHGAIYTPTELIKMVTGEELTAKYFIDYLNNKYSSIYELR